MQIALWAAQIILALIFAMAGFMKVSQPIAKLAPRMTFVNHVQASVVRLIGSLELLGALGLILPAVTHILPWLTPLAASGLALTMIGAIITHILEKDYKGTGVPVVLLLLSLFVAYGRFVILPL